MKSELRVAQDSNEIHEQVSWWSSSSSKIIVDGVWSMVLLLYFSFRFHMISGVCLWGVLRWTNAATHEFIRMLKKVVKWFIPSPNTRKWPELQLLSEKWLAEVLWVLMNTNYRKPEVVKQLMRQSIAFKEGTGKDAHILCVPLTNFTHTDVNEFLLLKETLTQQIYVDTQQSHKHTHAHAHINTHMLI